MHLSRCCWCCCVCRQLLEKLSLVRPMSASDRVMAEKARDKLKRRQQQEQQHEQ